MSINAYVKTVYMFYFDKVGGGTPDRPIPIKSPNDLGLLPGEKAVLWYYDESPNEGEAPNDWAIAGTGTVTEDGMYIVSDPGVGIPKFCCGATTYGGTPLNSPPSGPSDDPCKSNNAGDPVNLLTGYFMHEKIDYRVPGIIPVEIKRTYRSGDQGLGGFGKGTFFGYDWWLNISSTSTLVLIMPGNYQYTFTKQKGGSTFVNTTDPAYSGDVISQNSDGSYTLKRKNGWSYTFNPNLLSTIKDPNGNTLTFFKEIDGNISRIVMPDGRQVNINYIIGDRDNVSSISGPLGTVTYTYYNTGSTGKLKSVQYADGSTVSYEYDSSGRMTKVTENGKVVVINTYDANNRVTQQTHSDGGVYTFNYTIAGGNITQTSMTAPNGGVTTWRFYDDSGAYRGGYITKKTTPDGTTTYNRAAGTNLLQSVTDPLGMTTSYTYDTQGRVTAVTDPTGKKTTYTYENTCSGITQITDALNDITKMTYDTKCNLLTITTPLNEVTTFTYNALGLPITIKDPLNNTTTMAYDNSGNLTTITDPLGNVNTMTYDSMERLISHTDANGKITNYGYDLAGRVTQVQDALGNITTYSYNPSGKLTMFTDAKNNGIIYEYDDRDRVVKMTDQLRRIETYTYYRGSEITPTTGDNLKSVTDRKGQTTTFQYDLMNRVTKATYADGSYTTYTYDADGRVTDITDSISGNIHYVYETAGCTSCGGGLGDRLLQETTPLGSISYTYDNIGRRIGMTVSGQPQVTYTYDKDSRLTKVSRQIGSATKDFTLSYDIDSRRASLQVLLHTSKGKNYYLTDTYTYDTANRLKEILQQGPTATIEDLRYEYDPNGNRTKYTRNAAQPSRDAVTGAAYNDANEMLTFQPSPGSAKNMTYDENGNLLTIINSCGTTTYTWDVRNRLKSISGYTSTCATLTASFKYDAIGRRIEKTINGTTTQYVYDGLDIIQEKQGGTVTANYIRTLNIDEPLTRIKGSTVRHYVTDALGSIIALTDDSGAVKTTYTYDPFGNVTISGETSDSPFQYTGRENDGTGLYYYRARYYSPELQRFISEDPIGLEGGDVNFYAYVGNNPVNWIDPWGLYQCVNGAVCDFTPAMDNALKCFDKCTKNDSKITSGRDSHPSDDPHMKGEACDIGRNTNQNLKRDKAETCFSECFRKTSYAQEEYNSGPGTHFHFQITPGIGGAYGFREGIREHGRRRR